MSLKIRVRTARWPHSFRRCARIPHSPNLLHSFHRLSRGGGERLVVAAATSNPKITAHNKPIYDELIKPEEKKIVWYSPPKKTLPDVSAQQRIGTFPTPRAPIKSAVAIIATAPKPKSVKQFIWQPVPKVEIHQDLPAPNLIARAAMAIPAPPPPPEPKPKIDKPDTQGVKSPQPNISPPAPNGDVNKAEQTNTQPVEIPKPRKAFVPPPPSQRPARAGDSSANGGCPAARCQYYGGCHRRAPRCRMA